MIVAELYVNGVTVDEGEADAPLSVDRDGVLAFAITPEGVEPVSGRFSQVPDGQSLVE